MYKTLGKTALLGALTFGSTDVGKTPCQRHEQDRRCFDTVEAVVDVCKENRSKVMMCVERDISFPYEDVSGKELRLCDSLKNTWLVANGPLKPTSNGFVTYCYEPKYNNEVVETASDLYNVPMGSIIDL